MERKGDIFSIRNCHHKILAAMIISVDYSVLNKDKFTNYATIKATEEAALYYTFRKKTSKNVSIVLFDVL